MFYRKNSGVFDEWVLFFSKLSFLQRNWIELAFIDTFQKKLGKNFSFSKKAEKNEKFKNPLEKFKKDVKNFFQFLCINFLATLVSAGHKNSFENTFNGICCFMLSRLRVVRVLADQVGGGWRPCVLG